MIEVLATTAQSVQGHGFGAWPTKFCSGKWPFYLLAGGSSGLLTISLKGLAMKAKNWIFLGAGVFMFLLLFQAQASEPVVVENFFMTEAVSYNPVMVCPKESWPHKDSGECKGLKGQTFQPIRVAEYLQEQCPGAILRSLSPAPYTRAAQFGRLFRTVIGNFAIGFEPPIGGCRHAEKADKKITG